MVVVPVAVPSRVIDALQFGADAVVDIVMELACSVVPFRIRPVNQAIVVVPGVAAEAQGVEPRRIVEEELRAWAPGVGGRQGSHRGTARDARGAWGERRAPPSRGFLVLLFVTILLLVVKLRFRL